MFHLGVALGVDTGLVDYKHRPMLTFQPGTCQHNTELTVLSTRGMLGEDD